MNLSERRAVFGVVLNIFFLSCAGSFAQPAVSWSQPPGFLIYTNDPDVRGGNRPSSFDWNRPQTNQTVVADDFICDRYRVLRLRWWGSYFPGYEPLSETNFFEDAYVFSFFLDYANQPLALVGTYVAPITNVSVTPTIYTGADGHRIFQYEVDFNQVCLVDERLPDAEPGGFHGVEGRRYWLSIQAAVGRRYSSATNQNGLLQCTYEPTSKTATNTFWGWHTSPTNRAAASVSGDAQLTGNNLTFSNWQANTPLHGDVSQAFELFTGCDSKPPRLVSARGFCAANLVVEVVYDEKVDPVTAGDEFAYGIWDSDHGLSVIAADVIGRFVWLFLDPNTPLPCSNSFRACYQL